MTAPFTKQEKITEIIGGIKIIDSFRWLEKSSDPEVQKWVEKQNEYTKTEIKDTLTKIFSEELARNFDGSHFSVPVAVKGVYFFTERKAGENQKVLYVKKGLNGNVTALVNPNKLDEKGTISLSYWNESRSGKYVAYGLDEGGTEMSTLYIKDVVTNKNVHDIIPNCRYSIIRWLPDDSGFYYTKNSYPEGTPKNEVHLHTKVFLHILGEKPEKDTLIFGKNRPKEDKIGLSLSLDGRYLAISVSQNWIQNDIYIYDTESKKTTPLLINLPFQFSIRFLKKSVLLHTNYKANNYRVISTSYAHLFKSIDEWKEIIKEDTFTLESLWVSKDKIFAGYLVNACSQIKLFDFSGKSSGEIPIPPLSAITGFLVRRDESEFFYGIESFISPHIIYHFNPSTEKFSLYKSLENPINPNNYVVSQEWYKSKDTTLVPLFIVRKKTLKLDGKNPTILYGYGGFGSSETPTFLRARIPWLERGGIFAIANIRGGGEFGEKWYKQGIKRLKQNSFDDFIAAAEFLINKKYTSSKYLGILGASNGGLLVSAVAVQEPELFKAICSQVPLTDMVRFPKFSIAIRWIHEYGNPNRHDELKEILKWSPYHNVKNTVVYPHFLFITAENDSRVNPLHARKMTARLQTANARNYAILLCDKNTGHGSGKPLSKVIETQSVILSFFAKELKLKM